MKYLRPVHGILTTLFFIYCVFGGLFFGIEITNIHVIIVVILHIQMFNWDESKKDEL